MSLLSDTYKTTILKIKRGHNNGVVSNAKPILVLAIIEAIDEGILLGNRINFPNDNLQELYATIYSRNYSSDGIYRANAKFTPFNLPYFHLNAEEFYHINNTITMISKGVFLSNFVLTIVKSVFLY